MIANGSSSSRRPFFFLFGLGVTGILSLVPFISRQVRKAFEEGDRPPGLPLPLVVVIALVQSGALLALAVAAGLKFAPRLGLHSHLAAAGRTPRAERRPFAWRAAIGGALLAPAVLLVGERFFRRWAGDALAKMEQENPRTPATTVMAVLYGGITEELLTRWGLLSALARGLQRLQGKPAGPASDTVMWAATAVAAFLFGAGHLPALASLAGLTPALVARTVLLNMSGGLIFGYLFWKHSLEAAMVAHGGAHIILAGYQRWRDAE